MTFETLVNGIKSNQAGPELAAAREALRSASRAELVALFRAKRPDHPAAKIRSDRRLGRKLGREWLRRVVWQAAINTARGLTAA